MTYKNECVLEKRECTDCGECDTCDLDSNKKCDNCCKCIESNSDYKGIYVDEVIEDKEEDIEDLEIKDNWKFNKNITKEYE